MDYMNRGNLCMVIFGLCMLKIDRGQFMLFFELYMIIFCYIVFIWKILIVEIFVLSVF